MLTEADNLLHPELLKQELDAKRDEYLDFAEDYDPLKKFFAGDQITIFDRAIRLMKIYDDSKTFIVDEDMEAVVGEIKAIMKKPIA